MSGAILRLDDPRKLNPDRPSSLLHPSAGFVDLVGRQGEHDALARFCDDEEAFCWRVLFGAGGVGKTRLAYELAIGFKAKGWDAGFIPGDALDRWVQGAAFPAWAPTNDTLILIDNAARKRTVLETLLLRLSQWGRENGGPYRVRLLLIERRANVDAGWLAELLNFATGKQWEALHAAMALPVRLGAPGRADPDWAMEALVRSTLEGWTRFADQPAPQLGALSPKAISELRYNTGRNPVFLQLAAIRACETRSHVNLTQWTQSELLGYAVARERAWVRNHCPEEAKPELVERAVAFLCLAGAYPSGDDGFLHLLRADARALGYSDDEATTTARALDAVAGKAGEAGRTLWLPVGHDLVGGAFAAAVLADQRELVETALGRVLDLGPRQVWVNLLRITGDLHSLQGFDLTHYWLDMVLPDRAVEELVWVSRQMADRNLQLSTFGLALHETLVMRLPQAEKYAAWRAETLHRLAVYSAELGRGAAAMETARMAAEAFVKLVETDRSVVPALAACMNNLAAYQSRQGHTEQAVRTGRQVVGLLKKLGESNPEAMEAELAGALSNLSAYMVDLGRWEEGLTTAESGVAHWERLTSKSPDAYMPGFAKCLNNLGVFCARTGRWDNAVRFTDRAVGFHRGLAERNPDMFEPLLAASLTNLANALMGRARQDAAVKAATEAVDLYEMLEARNPQAHQADLAMALNNLAALLYRTKRFDGAVRLARRAVEVFRPLAQRYPTTFTPQLAAALSNLTGYSAQHVSPEESLLDAKQALEHYRGLAEAQPGIYEADLAAALVNMGRITGKLRMLGPSLGHCREAVEIYERLAKEHHGVHDPALASARGALAEVFSFAGKKEESEDSWYRAVEALSDVYHKRPAPYTPLMATLVDGYVKSCGALGKRPAHELLAPVNDVIAKMLKKPEA